MKKKMISVLCLTMGLAMVSCQAPQQQPREVVASDTITLQDTDNEFSTLMGTYCGTFPAADCAGKQIELTLSEDWVYNLAYEYLDEDAHTGIIEECGVFSIINDSIIETVTPSSNKKTYYVYVHGNLVLCDSLGMVVQGDSPENYVLKKDTLQAE